MVTFPEGIAEVTRIHPMPFANHRRPKTPIVGIERSVHGIRLPRKRIVAAVTNVLRHERRSGHVVVVVVGDAMMRRLNQQFRAKDITTDVLSFPMADDSITGIRSKLIGEIYCNYDHCRRWQFEHGGTIADELLRLAVHGCLHLLGYDHHKPSQREAMSKAENRHLREIGLIGHRTRGLSND